MNLLAFLVATVGAVAVMLIAFGVWYKPNQLDLQTRLNLRLGKILEETRKSMSLTEAELKLSFFERVILPWLDRMGQRMADMAPSRNYDRLSAQLDLAGRPLSLTPAAFNALRAISLIASVLWMYGLAVFIGATSRTYLILVLVAGVTMGALLPRMLLARAISNRQANARRALPPALDLISLCVDAGMPFDAAIARVTEKYKSVLSAELERYLVEVRVGRPRADAIDALGARFQVKEITTFVQAVKQTEHLGAGFSEAMKIQAEEMRRRRREWAQQEGAMAPVKMLFPMIGCIFPTLLVVLVGPAVLFVVDTLGVP